MEDGGRRRRSGGEDFNAAGEGFASGDRGVGEHVEDDWRAAHVGDLVGGDGGVDRGGVEAAEANVRAADGSDPPWEAPAISVEHRKSPEINRLLWNRPIDQRIDSDDEQAAVAVDDALRSRRCPGGVVQYGWIPFTLRPPPLELRIAEID